MVHLELGSSATTVAAFLYNSIWSFAAAFLLGSIQLVERRKRSEPLHPSRQIAISTLIDSMAEAVFVIGSDGQIIEMNQAAERLCGAPKERLQAVRPEDLTKYALNKGPSSPEAEELALTRALRGEVVRQERRSITMPDGNVCEALINANPIREPDGHIVGALVVVNDITELAELQQHRQDAERQNAIGAMAASLAHDFNNVLDTISKAATVLEIAPDRPPAERTIVLRMIQNAVKRGAEIVENVRQYLTGGSIEPDLLDLNTLLEEAIELTRPMWQSATGVSLVRQFEPVQKVRANPAELRRVFTNLIINALDAMPRGGTLLMGCRNSDGTVRAFVEDTGEGIPPENRTKIFVPYYTTKKQGTGLGLSGALRAVRAQHGNISFTSTPGKGTRFVVELPAAEENGRRAA